MAIAGTILTGGAAWAQQTAPLTSLTPAPKDRRMPNVLFFAIDDLRTTLGCYGDPIAKTPNIDRLAARGTVMRRAYCQQAVCNPSRSSLMTGQRPDTIRVWDLQAHFRDELPEQLRDLPQFSGGTHFREARPDVITLPQWFKQHGYVSRGIGKIYHGKPRMDDPASWSVPSIHDVWPADETGRYVLPANRQKDAEGRIYEKQDSTECTDAPDNAYIDGQVANLAVEALGELRDRPFFLAMGFRKPHLPFCAPKKYWDMYDRQAIGGPAHPGRPDGALDIALHNSPELRGYRDIGRGNGPISPEKAMELRHGYYAAVSYMDAQVGKVLDELERLGLADNTIISLYGDHGYHLGEKGLWCKTTNYELDTNAPLIISTPGQSRRGTVANALCEFVDIYPTLTEAAGLPMPTALEGVSLMPLLNRPELSWKKAVFSQFPRPWSYKGAPEVMGYTMRTDRYRYTEWRRFTSGDVLERELYDHQTDPAEIHNQAGHPEQQSLLAELGAQMRGGWEQAKTELSAVNQ